MGLPMSATDEEPPEGVHCYLHKKEMPKEIQKYWPHRHDLFSLYDKGIWLTDDAWFGVTPETVAWKIAEDVAYNAPEHKTVLIDCFAGAGGNVIAFALSDRWDRIFAIEKDPATIACAKNNASIYGVDKKIFWIQGDCFSEIKKRFKGFGMGKEVVIFGSPPWGGPDYATDEVFDLNQMEPYPLDYLHRTFSGITTEFIIFLPRTSNLKQLATLVPDNKKMDVMHYSMNGFSKGMCAYFGDFFKFE